MTQIASSLLLPYPKTLVEKIVVMLSSIKRLLGSNFFFPSAFFYKKIRPGKRSGLNASCAIVSATLSKEKELWVVSVIGWWLS